jgi:hypothetical protein
MPGWTSIVIAAVALAYTIWANRQERHTREKEFALLRKQTELAEYRDLEERRAYVSVDSHGSEGGETFDLHRFVVTNAGPATVRHVSLRVDSSEGALVAGPAKVSPHILMPGEHGDAEVHVPRSERRSELFLIVEWVDPEQNPEWLEHQRRKERIVGPLSPVSPLP